MVPLLPASGPKKGTSRHELPMSIEACHCSSKGKALRAVERPEVAGCCWDLREATGLQGVGLGSVERSVSSWSLNGVYLTAAGVEPRNDFPALWWRLCVFSALELFKTAQALRHCPGFCSRSELYSCIRGRMPKKGPSSWFACFQFVSLLRAGLGVALL
jgi:hypothetical protein